MTLKLIQVGIQTSNRFTYYGNLRALPNVQKLAVNKHSSTLSAGSKDDNTIQSKMLNPPVKLKYELAADFHHCFQKFIEQPEASLELKQLIRTYISRYPAFRSSKFDPAQIFDSNVVNNRRKWHCLCTYIFYLRYRIQTSHRVELTAAEMIAIHKRVEHWAEIRQRNVKVGMRLARFLYHKFQKPS